MEGRSDQGSFEGQEGDSGGDCEDASNEHGSHRDTARSQKGSDSYNEEQESEDNPHFSSFIDDGSESPCLGSDVEDAFDVLTHAGFDVSDLRKKDYDFQLHMKKVTADIKKDQVELSNAIFRLEEKHDRFFAIQNDVLSIVHGLSRRLGNVTPTANGSSQIASNPPTKLNNAQYSTSTVTNKARSNASDSSLPPSSPERSLSENGDLVNLALD